MDLPRYKKYDKVRLVRKPTKVGVVWSDPLSSEAGYQYEVFFSAQDQRFVLEDDLSIYVELDKDPDGAPVFGNLDDLLRNLVLVKLRQPLADNLYALYASRTKFEVYQFKPALKFLGNPDQRLLIADEVGLGKTIEAGIIYLEMQARLEVMRVLVVCPSGLRVKWRDELRSRFDETFEILDADRLREFLSDYARIGELKRLRAIVSLELLRREEFAVAIAESHVHFDLVIFDEAHHCRNTDTLSNRIASIISDNADAMLLLTATPLHLGNQDLYHLLQILSPGEFESFDTFDLQITPNRYINRATSLLESGDHRRAQKELRKVETTILRQRFLGNPYYADTLDLLKKSELKRDELVQAQRNLMELNTLAHIFTRSRKREVQEDAPMRSAYTLRVEFSPDEWDFYTSLIEYVRAQYRETTGNVAVGWATIMRERQAASCITAVRDHFSELLKDEYQTTPEDEAAAGGIIEDEFSFLLDYHVIKSKEQAVRSLLLAAERIKGKDTKYDIFVDALRQVLVEDPASKIMVFSFFRGTLEYLKKRLQRDGFRLHMMHGGIPVLKRQFVVDEFRDNPEINILLSSEVGSEGLDFQFCDTLFNYDLPWNPMKVEQRIGRLDRFGQQAAKIRIYNLVINHSIEDRIFLRLYDRIGIFKESIGDLEAILGDEVGKLSRRMFSKQLTSSEEEELADQTAANIIRRKQELERFEEQRLEFMGQEAIFRNQVEEAIDSGRFVSGTELRALIETFIREKFPATKLEPDGQDDPTFALTPDRDFVTHIQNFVYRLKGSGAADQDFLTRLRPGKVLPLTFSAETAYHRKLVEFPTLRHPITQAAVAYWESVPSPGLPVASISFRSIPVYVGDYYFFMFVFHTEAMEQQTRLVPVVICMNPLQVAPRLSEQLLQLIQTSTPVLPGASLRFEDDRYALAKKMARQYAAEQRNFQELELTRSNEALINARMTAIEQSYQIKKRRIEATIAKVDEERVLRMHRAHLRNVEARYRSKSQELDSHSNVQVSFSLALAGLARVLPEF